MRKGVTVKKIPKLKTEEEEIEYWESLSIADYWDELEEGKDVFKRPKPKLTETSVFRRS